MLPELQRIKGTVRCVALGAEVPGHRHRQLTQTLIVENALFYTLIVNSQQNRIELVKRPGVDQPLFATKEDRIIRKFRQWYEQFYSKGSMTFREATKKQVPIWDW